MGAPESEYSAWLRATAGDGEAFGAIFDRHHARVHRHALSLVRTQADAQDVTAAAFLELWRKRKHVRVLQGSVLPWLLVTATNTARNQQRSLRRYRALLDALPRQPQSYDPHEDLSDDLAAQLADLDPIDQGLLSLIALEGHSIKEAAELIGLTETGARTRLHRARKKLRSSLMLTRRRGVQSRELDSEEGTA